MEHSAPLFLIFCLYSSSQRKKVQTALLKRLLGGLLVQCFCTHKKVFLASSDDPSSNRTNVRSFCFVGMKKMPDLANANNPEDNFKKKSFLFVKAKIII